MGMLLPSTDRILDFLVSLPTLSALNDFLQDYDFVMIIMQEISIIKESPKHRLTLIFLNFLFKNFKREYGY